MQTKNLDLKKGQNKLAKVFKLYLIKTATISNKCMPKNLCKIRSQLKAYLKEYYRHSMN